MEKYRIITEEGKEILTASLQVCLNYWNGCSGIYEDEDGEHYIYIQVIR